ncbi:MAG: flagellar biosynthetic protein FliR [Gammaproteobacteria bacterium]|nr:flagellar biosynthetic protein FliR [Gammaproteobacteria bacterium]
MIISATELTALIGAYLWPLFRVSAMVATAPVFGTRSVPMKVKIMTALAITSVLVPVIPAPEVNVFSPLAVIMIAQQILIGVIIGFTVQLVFSAVITGGQIVAMQMGLGFSLMVDPQNGAQSPVLSQFYILLVMLVYLAINGHLVLVEVLAESFRTMPVSANGLVADDFMQVVRWGTNIFAGGLAIALPAIASLLVVNIAFGVMTRSAPQLNIFAIGFPITMMLGFALVMITLPNVGPKSISLFSDVYQLLQNILDIKPGTK